MALGLRTFAERVGEGSGEPRLYSEELVHVQPSVSIVLDHRPVESPGTLYITTKKLVWLNDVDRAKGYAVDFLSVSLHAVSRDPEAYPSPCIYAQIETDAHEDEATDSDVEYEEFDLAKVTEMRLVPSDPSQLDTLFSVFCECAELNPDPNAEPGEENEWVFGNDQMMGEGLQGDSQWNFSDELTNPIGFANGNHDLADTVLELQIDDERFEDAEEGESDTKKDHR